MPSASVGGAGPVADQALLDSGLPATGVGEHEATTEPDRYVLAPDLPTALVAVAVAVLAFASYPLGASAAIAGVAAFVLVFLASIDIQHGIIPNRIVLPAAAVLFAARVAFYPGRTVEVLAAAALAAFVLLLPHLISSSWMGMGDVKLGLLLGATLGWGALGAIVVAFLAVFPVAAIVLIRNGRGARGATLPFGPFLALGALVILIVPRMAGLGS